ncbi:dynamin family protein [Streptomyces sp. NPDC086787]|uniref:dynamin family protein n=1 Tax=Streptomyces sp. NPDC086787 TaxID=3365759 RepID=UPI003812C07B
MARQLSLGQLGEYVRDVESFLDSLDPPAGEEEATARGALARAAAKVRARASAPISLAVVGEFTVGKSLLLGALLGRPDLLPVEERPTTGNITVLRLREGAREEGTRLGGTSKIHFMTRDRLASCVREITQELARLLDEQLPQLRAGQVLGGTDLVGGAQGWAPFLGWYRCLWGQQVPGLPVVPYDLISSRCRDAALELLRFRDAEQGEQELLGSGPVELDTATVRRVLELPVAAPTPDAPPTPRKLTITRERVTAGGSALSDCFPLVERVEQTVEVDPAHWPLHELLDGRDVQILDFPGVGAVGSFGRDRNLSRQALQDIHSILLVLPAHHLPSDIALDFWQMLAADGRSQEALGTAALLVANQFDRIVVPTLEAGQQSGTGLDRVDSLNSLAAFAPKIIGQGDNRDQIFLASAVTGILREQQPWGDVSKQTRDVLRHGAERASDPNRPTWSEFAALLEREQPGSRWAQRLRSFEEDGGLDTIRRGVQEHLVRHGDVHRLERARAAQRELDQALRAYRRVAPRDEPPEAEAYREAAARFRELGQLIDRILDDIELLDEEHLLKLPEAPTPPEVETSRAAVRTAVYSSHWWEQLLQRAQRSPDHLVPHGQPQEDDELSLSRRRRTRPSADDTAVFQQLFQRVLTDQRAHDLERLQTWLEDWRGYWSEEVGAFRSWLDSDEDSALLLPDLYTRRMQTPDILEDLLNDLDVDALVAHVAARAPKFLAATAVEPAHAFPLQPGHALPWHAESDNGNTESDERSRHPLTVLQMRASIADAAADQVGAQLHGLLRRVLQVFRDNFDGARESLLDQEAFRPTATRQQPGPTQEHTHTEHAGEVPDEGPRPVGVDELIRRWQNGERRGGGDR